MSEPNDLPYIMLCTDLGLLPENVPPNLKSFLLDKLAAAADDLRADGIDVDLSGTARDRELWVLYAAWLYRGRVQQQPMPDMLQRRIQNRQTELATKPRWG